MNNTTSSCPSFHCSFENTRPLAILAFVVIVVIVIDLVRDCLLSRSSDSPASVLRQDHGGASVQVQVVIPNSDDCCAVCLGEYTDGGAAVRQLPECGHVFHRSCIDLWLRIHSTCPLCRHSTVAVAQPPPVADQ